MDFKPTTRKLAKNAKQKSEHLLALPRAVHFIIQFGAACKFKCSLGGLRDRFVVARRASHAVYNSKMQ